MNKRVALCVVSAIATGVLGNMIFPGYFIAFACLGWILAEGFASHIKAPKPIVLQQPMATLWTLAARADGNISSNESDQLHRLMLAHGTIQKTLTEKDFTETLKRTIDPVTSLDSFASWLNGISSRERLIAVYGSFLVLYADGKPNTEELKWSTSLQKILKEPDLYTAAISAFEESKFNGAGTKEFNESDLKELGLNKGATESDIKAAYRRLAVEYHPDKHAGVAESLRKLAEEKFKAIQSAYERLAREPASPTKHLTVLDKNGNPTPVDQATKGNVVCCWHCGQKNRLPEPDSFRKASCGACHGLLALDEVYGTFIRDFRAGAFRNG